MSPTSSTTSYHCWATTDTVNHTGRPKTGIIFGVRKHAIPLFSGVRKPTPALEQAGHDDTTDRSKGLVQLPPLTNLFA